MCSCVRSDHDSDGFCFTDMGGFDRLLDLLVTLYDALVEAVAADREEEDREEEEGEGVMSGEGEDKDEA